MENVNKHRGHNILISEEVTYKVNLEKKTFEEHYREWMEHGDLWCENCSEEIDKPPREFRDEIIGLIRAVDEAADKEERFVNTGKNILLLLLTIGTALYIF